MVKELTILNSVFTSIIGIIIGNVIFQKPSQAVAPSHLAASYRVMEMVCRPARKIRI
ncbi:hypothetical protein D3C80_1936870 [compost metagenome]